MSLVPSPPPSSPPPLAPGVCASPPLTDLVAGGFLGSCSSPEHTCWEVLDSHTSLSNPLYGGVDVTRTCDGLHVLGHDHDGVSQVLPQVGATAAASSYFGYAINVSVHFGSLKQQLAFHSGTVGSDLISVTDGFEVFSGALPAAGLEKLQIGSEVQRTLCALLSLFALATPAPSGGI